MRGLHLALTLCAMVAASSAAAKDYGQVGTVFPVTEFDMLRTIENKLALLQSTGQIDAMN